MPDQEFNFKQGGEGNTQNNTFNFTSPRQSQLTPSNLRNGA